MPPSHRLGVLDPSDGGPLLEPGATPEERVLAYHERTKHHFHRYAASLGFLDWASQPDPFRRYPGAELHPLPLPPPGDPLPFARLYLPGAVPAATLSRESVSRFFRYALSLTGWKQLVDSRWALRANPSSGNLHPSEGYAILPALPGLAGQPAIYHYAPREHGLERRADLDAQALAAWPAGSFLVGLSSIHWREAWKYGERAFRYCQHDAGHALGTLRYAAAALGWRLELLDLPDAGLAALLGLDRRADRGAAEAEHPDFLALVGAPGPAPGVLASQARSEPQVALGHPGLRDIHPVLGVANEGGRSLTGHPGHATFGRPAPAPDLFRPGTACSPLPRVQDARWHGQANLLSPEHRVDWPVIAEVAQACWRGEGAWGRPHLAAQPGSAQLFDRPGEEPGPAAETVILGRRSAVRMDGSTALPRAAFFHLLGRLVPTADGAAMPWDALPWRPRVHLGLFVHRVQDLEPGLYALVRDPSQVERLRAAMHPEHRWQRPAGCPPGLPLYLLREGDVRGLAARVSCGQAIAGDGAFSLGMLADYQQALLDDGAPAYRWLHWEAGLIGQVLYLEAEAAGVRATGIGCYFDDPVHQVFGLTGWEWQSLYHFTVGGAVEDPRLISSPAYAGLESHNLLL